MTTYTENRTINESEILKKDFICAKDIGTDYTFKRKIVWTNAVGFLLLHLLGLWGLGVVVTGGVGLKTLLWYFIVGITSSQGVTVGAHRYFTHKSFKATPLLRALLLLAHTIAGQNCMLIWCRDHRQHHRYSDTDADPHNASRGFFFSHMGWLMVKKHPKVIELGKTIDTSDLQADWMVMFQKKYYFYLFFVFSFFVPIWVPVQYFGESWLNSFLVCFVLRYIHILHGTWAVNSLAHLYGTRPYDKKLQPVESWFVSFVSVGEGWHNYHHAFPWDYKAAELWDHINFSARTIHLCEKLGLAYDLKSASAEQVKNRALLTGDGTHHVLGNDEARACVTAIGPVHPLNPLYGNAKGPSINVRLENGGREFRKNHEISQGGRGV